MADYLLCEVWWQDYFVYKCCPNLGSDTQVILVVPLKWWLHLFSFSFLFCKIYNEFWNIEWPLYFLSLCANICIFGMFAFQPTSPIRAEIDVKLGGTQCNIIISRLKPWMQLHFSKKKKMVLQEGAANPDKVHSTDFKAIMWTCTVSAPEMTTVLYSLSGIPLYHVSDFINYLFIFLLGYWKGTGPFIYCVAY